MSAEENTYGQILRTSSIVGGAQAANYVIGLVRVKIVAMLLGPSGVGLISLYTSANALVGTVSGLGVSSSGVREVVRAYGKDDAAEAARTVLILRRVCWATGVFGWLLAILLAEPISLWMTGSPENAFAIAVLGSTLLLNAISSGQLALLQGLRRIGDLARANVFGSLAGSAATILIYFWLREAGVLPALIAAALVTLASSYWYSRRAPVASVAVGWRDTLHGFGRLLGLGLAFMWSAVLVAGVDMLTRSVITRQFGIDAAGIYQAAWALSGVFASFVLSAMGADFYPRLTAMIHDRALAIRAVSEQTEIGILLVLPGLLGALVFSPQVIKILYSPQFLPAADLLPWMALGVFGRVVSWPLGFVQLAMGASRWFAATETVAVCLQASLTLWLLKWFGPIGAAYAFAASYAIYIVLMLWVARALIGFSWSSSVRELIVASSAFVGAAFVLRWALTDIPAIVGGSFVTLAGSVFCLLGLAKRLGEGHKVSRLLRFFVKHPPGNRISK